jgi:uncharacterized protein (TIGR04141 family)
MPRRANPTARVTVYQLQAELAAESALRDKYLARDEFTVDEVEVAGRAGILARGVISREQASWTPLVGRWIANEDAVANLGNATAAGVLLLPTSDPASGRIWALCFGMGYHMLEPTRTVPEFGRRLAVRCADPARLKSLTHARLDARAFVARTSIPSGDDLAGFGAGDMGDLVTRMVGPARLDGLLASEVGTSTELRGADAANLALPKDPVRLLADLDTLETIAEREPLPALAGIEHLRALKSSDSRLTELDRQLDAALGEPDNPGLGLAWPTELADEAAPISHFVIQGRPRGEAGSDDGSLEQLLDVLRDQPDGRRTERLNRMKVQAFSDEDEPASTLLTARRWLSFETSLGGRRYCMHDGRWYSVDDTLAKVLRARVTSIFDAPSPLDDFPEWATTLKSELKYNQMLAERLGGVCLDQKLIVSDTHRPPGFEACDVLTPDGVYVHVKELDRSKSASHLWAQAGVSMETLLGDASAMSRLRELVKENGGDPDWVPERVSQVVVGLARAKLIDADSLFSFSKIRLVRLADECRARNVQLSVKTIIKEKPAQS